MKFKTILFFPLFLLISLAGAAQVKLSDQNLAYINQLPDEIKNQILSRLNDVSESELGLNAMQVDEVDSIVQLQTKIDEDFFGQNYFRSLPLSYTPVTDIPFQSSYELSFGDELEIVLTGDQERVIDSRVSLNGDIFIPEIGRVSLNNLSLEDAQEKLQKIISNYYLETMVFLNVKNASLKKISVIGAVNNPGVYLVNPFVSVSEAIRYAGGLKNNSSLRNVTVRRFNSSEEIKLDLYELLVFGNRVTDIALRNGDTVLIKPTSNFVEIKGEVPNSSIYEYIDSDTYEDLVNFSGGAMMLTNLDRISIGAIENSELITSKVSFKNKIGKTNLVEMFVPRNSFSTSKNMLVTGTSVNDGYYDFSIYENMFDFVKSIKFNEEIYPFFFVMESKSANDFSKKVQYLNLQNLETLKNTKIPENTKITFFDRKEIDLFNFEDYLSDEFGDNYLEVLIGSDQIKLPMVGYFSPKDVLSYIGSPKNINPENISYSNNKKLFIQGDIGLDKNLLFESGANLNIPTQASNLNEVTITGFVNYPGTYKIAKSTTLKQLYDIAGGLIEGAGESAVYFSRESIKKAEKKAYESAKDIVIDAVIGNLSNPLNNSSGSIDVSFLGLLTEVDDNLFPGRLAGNFAYNSDYSINLILEDGDKIFIPSKPNTIYVTGEVLSPVALVFDNQKKIKDYIDIAGGYTKYSNKSAVYVIRSNGTSVTMDNLKKLYPGDTIVVPRNLDKVNTLPLVSAAARIISDLAFSRASLNAIRN